jgi:hypothetical protein
MTTEAITDTISAMAGIICSALKRGNTPGIASVSIQGTINTPVENCSLNQSASKGQKSRLSILTEPIAPTMAHNKAAIRQ